jgi:hypothetical protein
MARTYAVSKLFRKCGFLARVALVLFRNQPIAGTALVALLPVGFGGSLAIAFRRSKARATGAGTGGADRVERPDRVSVAAG